MGVGLRLQVRTSTHVHMCSPTYTHVYPQSMLLVRQILASTGAISDVGGDSHIAEPCSLRTLYLTVILKQLTYLAGVP